jgi:very-short-patch-repair endonuclease
MRGVDHRFVDMRAIRSAPPGDRRAAAFARAQEGVVSLEQLMEACGLSSSGVARRVAADRLHRWAPRVFAVGHPALTYRGRAIAALLFSGEEATLSHADAAQLLEMLLPTERARVHVTVPARRRSTPRVRVHVSSLHPHDVATRGRLPVTAPARTLLDLAETTSERLVEQALDRARLRRLLTSEALEQTLARASGRRGLPALRRAYALHLEASSLTRSELEEAFLAFLRAREFPAPLVNVPLLGHTADFHWPRHALVVETDGLRAHTTPGAFERDRRRDRVHRAGGLRVERVTWGDVVRHPDALEAEMRPWFGRG